MTIPASIFGGKPFVPVYVFGKLIDTDGTEYPDSDGEPMADNTLQWDWIAQIKDNLETLFADRDDVFVAGDLMWYPVHGDSSICRAPDAMVVFGRPKGYRGSYIQWIEGKIAPQVVFEILSPSNSDDEMAKKHSFYERHGVEEYYLYDPYKPFLTVYQRNPATDTLNQVIPASGYTSPRLGVRFTIPSDGSDMQIYRPDGEPFRNFTETYQLREKACAERDAATTRANEESARANEASARAERLAARLHELGIEE